MYSKILPLIRWVREYIPDAAIILAILLTGWVYTFDINQVIAIDFYDESYYLRNGFSIPTEGLPPADGYPRGAPLYALWYWFLSFIKHDNVELYYYNYKIASLLPAIMCFAFLRTSGVSRLFSVCFAFILFTTLFSIAYGPRISHFALAVLLFGLSFTSVLSTVEAKLSLSAVTALLASYVRPEFFLTFISLWLVVGVLVGYRLIRSSIKLSLYPLVSALVASVLLILVLGVPFASMNRSWDAFRQHYALNASKWTSSDVNPWTDSLFFIRNAFSGSNSVMEALLSNPGAFGKHIHSNISQLPSTLYNIFIVAYPISPLSYSALKIACIMFLLAGLTQIQRQTMFQPFVLALQRVKSSLWLSFIVALFLIPPLLSMIVIYPRQHYALFLSILPLHIISVLFPERLTNGKGMLNAFMVCLLILFMIRPVSSQIPIKPDPNLAIVNFLKSLRITQSVNLLGSGEDYGIYTGEKYHMLPYFLKKDGFNKFIKTQSVDIIVVSKILRINTLFSLDPEWKVFLDNPSSQGFSVFSVKGAPDHVILVKTHLLESTETKGRH